jgi:ParB family chromosome partitioning protein
VVVRDGATDPYAQAVENLMRQALSPIEIARFIKGRVDAGESNATVAKRIGMNLTSVAHHLTPLELPAELDQAMQSATKHPRR